MYVKRYSRVLLSRHRYPLRTIKDDWNRCDDAMIFIFLNVSNILKIYHICGFVMINNLVFKFFLRVL